mmetsp:Transcript_68773/g.109127  ORF Transcript_68773/g.109127 Transcript_68773/m.109127 type:complete len:208 (+) Transcript_68773:2-625(+)
MVADSRLGRKACYRDGIGANVEYTCMSVRYDGFVQLAKNTATYSEKDSAWVDPDNVVFHERDPKVQVYESGSRFSRSRSRSRSIETRECRNSWTSSDWKNTSWWKSCDSKTATWASSDWKNASWTNVEHWKNNSEDTRRKVLVEGFLASTTEQQVWDFMGHDKVQVVKKQEEGFLIVCKSHQVATDIMNDTFMSMHGPEEFLTYKFK